MSAPDENAGMPRYPEPLAVRIPEACRMIGVGRSKLYELIADGTIQIVKIGSITVIPVGQLRALVEIK
ncbi:excisionase family DNA binding protein [Novosphingobium sp. PhB165]|nr:excisionase family DNA binding protein [Novosphingobium sp. PhB165]